MGNPADCRAFLGRTTSRYKITFPVAHTALKELWIFACIAATTTAAYTIHDVVPPAIQSSARLAVLDRLPSTQSQLRAAAAQPFCDRLCSGWFALQVYTDSTCTHAKARSNVTDACTRSAILAHDDPHMHNIGTFGPQR